MHLLAIASLKNRALIALITICVAVFGGVALSSLKTELAPDITLPQVVVVTSQPGSSPDIINGDITEPVEAAIQAVPGLESTSGTSRTGSSTVVASFAYGQNLATTEQRVQQAINRIQRTLPEGVTPGVFTGSFSDFPIVQIAVAAGSDEAALVDRLEQIAIPALERLTGVREATVSGASGQRITIAPDDAALAARGLDRQAIADAIDKNGVLLPGGTVNSGDTTLSVQIGSPLTSVADIASVPLAAGLTIGDVATVELGADPASTISLVNGERSLTIGVTKTQEANTTEVSNAIRELLPSLADDLGGTELTIVFDQAPFIEQSISALTTEGLLGLVFAVLVILVFLLSVRSTLVTAISIPASVLITFIGLWATGYSMNILTLGALTIAIGRVVDDSIVVIENIKRHLSFERSRGRAIIDAVREVAGAITASTVTTVIVFLPLAFVGDVTGELFRPFAITVSIALLASLVVALTIVPVLAYWMLPSTAPEPPVEPAPAVHGRHADARPRGLARFFRRSRAAEPERQAPAPVPAPVEERPDALRRGYRPILRTTLAHPVLVLVGSCLVLAASVAAWPLMGTNFLGDSGQTTVRVSEALEPGASLDVQLAAAERSSAAIEGLEGVETVQATISQGASATSAFTGGGAGGITYSVTAAEGTDMPALTERLRDALADASGEVSIGESGGGFGGSDIEIDVTAAEESALADASRAVLDAVGGLDAVAQATGSLEASQPIVQVSVDRAAAARLGLPEAAVAGLVAQAMQPQPVGDVQLDGTVVQLYLAPTDPAATLDELRALSLPLGAASVPLTSIATVEQTLSPASITTLDGQRTATITVTPAGDDVGAASREVTTALESVQLPSGAEAAVGGVATQMTDALTQLGIAALIAILLVYIVMVATFKSLLQPFLLLVSVPFAATGAIGMQLITGVPLGVASMVGVLMLVGIVVTNAIVLIDLVNQARDRGMTVRDALQWGAERRLRPILMTAAATVFALVPMALGITGHGGFISQPLAIVVIGGLVSSTVLTLVVLPVLYLVVEGGIERRRMRRGRATRSAARDEIVARPQSV